MSHFGFIAISYGFAALLTGALAFWILRDHRAQKRQLEQMDRQREARGD